MFQEHEDHTVEKQTNPITQTLQFSIPLNISPYDLIQSTDEELLTIAQVARIFKVDQTTVRRWIKAGALVAITLPQTGTRTAYRVKKSVVNAKLGYGG